ncbi:MAG: glycosyltransferase [Slackia faecicanis]|uniref:glycosyltransferase family 2 protein n=1 Tax=Slackia faecicanis TaxID=255723 RepID=UPI00137B920E|nr:glycosyltransferase [Slackia faecicanis]MDO5357926.1 glycosyltransferase [Slackia faecicanis]
MAKFSIIIPVYNVEKYLSYCLDSVRAQTYDDLEVICVDDGSTDRSARIIELHAAADPRIRLVSKENGGVSSAKNAGMREATGDYVLCVDADDALVPEACERLVRAFRETDADVVTFGANCVPACDGYPWLVDCLSPRDAVYDGFDWKILLEEKSRPFAWRTATTRAFLVDNGIAYDESLPLGEDQAFHFDVYPLARKTAFISDKLYDYRVVREGSAMRMLFDDLAGRMGKHLDIVEAVFSSWDRRGLIDLGPSRLADWSLDFLFLDIRALAPDDAQRAFARLKELYERYLEGHGDPAAGLSDPIARVYRRVLEGSAQAMPRMELWRYVAARMGRKAYVKGLVMRPFIKAKDLFRRKAGPSKKQLAGWLDGEKERAACDKRLADSLEELLLSNLE